MYFGLAPAASISSKYTQSVSVLSNAITITYNELGNSTTGDQLQLVAVPAGGSINWVCISGANPTVTTSQGSITSTLTKALPGKYAPANCRLATQ
ncbi:pilin [Acidihalobacter yilgarnensis]|uniref:pilin n=1 Tax=Acidihalobacter yilgarnensis TaxID=2819280 RepID=UPI0018D40716|nr:pilin [Acidihalobacter yilgarnensis]